MRKSLLLFLCLLCFGVSSVQAQLNPTEAREAEWKSFAVPRTNFVRQINAEKTVVFRVPADWKQEGSELSFNGPYSSKIRVFAQKVPDGYPLQDYFASILQAVKDTPGAAEATLTRKTQLQDLEAREIVLDLPTTEGEVTRYLTWITVSGPLAVTFNLQAPTAHAAEVEPFFKAVVQSVIVLPSEHITFESLRAATLKSPAPGPIHEIESIVALLNQTGIDRESAIAKLSTLFFSTPDVAIDLLVDRRPLVRAATVQALARANNKTLEPFLWELVDDKEPLVAEAAARSVAGAPDVIAKMIEHSLSGLKLQTIARVWPFMTKEKKSELLQMVFSQTAARPDPLPPAAKTPGKGNVSVTVTELEAYNPGAIVSEVPKQFSNDPHVQIGVLTLLNDVPCEDFKLPFEKILASQHDPLISVALQVALNRGESLPVAALLKLAASSNQQITNFAVQNLAISAGVADIPRVEALISKDTTANKKDDELKLTVRKIRFRNDLSAAKSPTESREIVSKALADSSLSSFAWRYDCEASVSGCTASQTRLRSDFVVKPFAENLFPEKVHHFTAIPKPGQAVEKFYETLHGLQMDSPRAQSNLVLVLAGIRQMVAQQLSAPGDAPALIDYAGIDPDAPIAIASWVADKAPDSAAVAQRRAIVLRVKDRGRFERVVDQFQQPSGSFANLGDYIGIGTRAIAALPAILPLSAQSLLSEDPAKPKRSPQLPYTFIGEAEWNGLHFKTIQHRSFDADWEMQSSITYMLSLGDTVILTPDLATMRDLLTKTESEAGHLAANPEFRKAVEQRADVVYFSDFKAIMAEVADVSKWSSVKINESGALNIANASWENSHHLVFDESDWAKPLLAFHPRELSAPRALLPSSTIAYYLMNVDLSHAWSSKTRASLLPDDSEVSKLWALDFKNEVLPELGSECGAALLELNKGNFEGSTWAAFCKLKSNKLADALKAGKLFTGIGPANDFVQLKHSADSYYVAARNGFLIVTNHDKGVAAFDGKSNLAATRDYSKAVEKVPGAVVAFGGYNLEAAIAAASKTPIEGLQGQIASILFSVASAFHSQNFYATATAGTIEAHSSVAMDREGRYAVSDFAFAPRAANITLATVEPGGVPITDQNRLSSLVLKVKAKAAGPIDNIKDDIKTADQTIEQKSATELTLTIGARRSSPEKPVELPIKEAAFQPYLKATAEFPAENQQVKDQARQITGDDRDAWSVARKLADWTHKNLEWKHVADADPEKTLATREADCSEFSTLFVAMARSVGLPSRIVSGLAYSGSSFGGHAWVEVWAGRWVELDPTWGTDFVDATHIRNESGSLVTSAALNLIDFEVLETRRTVTDFQKSPKALAQHLLKAIPAGNRSDIEAVVDLATITDEFMGADTWSKMNDRERDQMSSAYRRVLNEIIAGYGKGQYSDAPRMRLLHLEEKGEVAEATCLLNPHGTFLKLRLVRRHDIWYLVEIVQADSSFHTTAMTIQPAITTIERARAGEKAVPAGPTDFVRMLFLLAKEPAKAIAIADNALKNKPNDQGLRYLKTLALLNLEKKEDAFKLLRELTGEGFTPAILKLAYQLNGSDDAKEQAEAIVLFERYTTLEPYDSRAFRDLGDAYDTASEPGKAEAAYRKTIELSPADSDGYLRLIDFLILQDRVGEVAPWLVAADKQVDDETDVFGSAMENLTDLEDSKYAVKFAASEPSRMKTSARANLALGQVHFDNRRYATALQLFNVAAQLDKEWAAPHNAMAVVHRKQFHWAFALKAAEQALQLDDENADAHYNRACALARLRRTKEAMEALQKAVELDPDIVDGLSDEPDLKALASLPEFKKLMPPPAKP